MAKELLIALQNRYENIFKNPVMGAALYLDPRFRSEIIRFDEKCEQAKNVLLDIWRRLNVLHNQNNNTINTSCTSNDSASFDEEAALVEYISKQKVIEQSNFQTKQSFDIKLCIDSFQPDQLSPNESMGVARNFIRGGQRKIK